ncbi:restriction endonuclease subunit S [Bradyrhizobium sp. 139]|nr:restriction endonuclease subunit S [Bradyrhizobium sp. 139]
MAHPQFAIEEFCETGSGGTPDRSKQQYYGGSIPWVKSGELREDIIQDTEERITELGLKESSAKLVPRGSILLAMYGATVGRMAFLGIDAATNQAVCNVRPDPKLADPRYVFHGLQSKMSHFLARAAGGAQPNISQAIVRETKLALPSLDEQRRIAAILDKTDALRRKRKSMLELVDELTTGLFRKAFVEGDEGSWPSTTVAEVALNLRTGPFGSQLLHSEFVDNGIAVLGIDNAVENEFRWTQRRFISEKKYAKLKRYTVLPGDVIITIMGTCGRCAVVPANVPTAINTKHLCCITLDRDKCLPEFLKAVFLQHPVVLKQLGVQAKGAVMPGLNMGIIKSLSFPLPPLAVQVVFAQTISALEDIRSRLRKASSEFELLFSSLQHRAFSGHL